MKRRAFRRAFLLPYMFGCCYASATRHAGNRDWLEFDMQHGGGGMRICAAIGTFG